jgi:hypothetical protein
MQQKRVRDGLQQIKDIILQTSGEAQIFLYIPSLH